MLNFANFALRTEAVFGCLGTDTNEKQWAPKSRIPQFSGGDNRKSIDHTTAAQHWMGSREHHPRQVTETARTKS
jgi:hypothetical protein